jgi:hypothetical protein
MSIARGFIGCGGAGGAGGASLWGGGCCRFAAATAGGSCWWRGPGPGPVAHMSRWNAADGTCPEDAGGSGGAALAGAGGGTGSLRIDKI